ncbi:MAG: FKBP-type peptidyl-prolyl cis-trans isomerase N-terminal domain-containing protein [Planctomycetota bacterium]
MTRKTLTGLLLAASAMTAGTLSLVHAQDDGAQQQADLEAAVAEALGQVGEKHDHPPTTVHSGDDKHFLLDDEGAYPDPDGFASMFDRVSYAIGRSDGQQIPVSQPDLNTETYAEGIRKGLTEEDEDYALGYSQGFDLDRRVLEQQAEDVNLEAFMKGVAAALKEENNDYALGYTQGYELARRFLDQRTEEVDMDAFVKGIGGAIKEDDNGKRIGYLIGNSYREAEIDLKADSYLAGIDEAMAKPEPAAEGEEPKPVETRLSMEQVQETLGAFQAYMMEKQKQEAIKAGTDYIDSLKAEDGWKKTKSGIAYRVIEEGKGDSPDYNDVATMDYELRLLEEGEAGGVLQTTFDGPQTVPFSSEDVIEGWGEILKLMNPGATFETVIPYNLGYREMGSPPNIPPYATLIFKMKMHSFEVVENKPEPKPEPEPEPEPEPAE